MINLTLQRLFFSIPVCAGTFWNIYY